MSALVVLTFLICGPGLGMCEEGTAVTNTCARAEAYIRAGLRAGQTLTVLRCETQ